MILETMINRLTDATTKEKDSGIYKIIKLAADGITENETTLLTVKEWRDIDSAQGTTLDRIGKDEGQPRLGLSDDEYRQKIKMKIFANLSGGEIDKLNSICLVLMGNRYVGIDEGWTLPEYHPIGPEPAMMLFTVKADGVTYGLPIAEIDDIRAGGVGANWQLLIDRSAKIHTNYEKSSEASAVYTGKTAIHTEKRVYKQEYLKAGEALISANLLNGGGLL